MSYALPCIKCGRVLENSSVGEKRPLANQPNDGISFNTNGHYGTTVFDPMDGSFIEINICDPCISQASREGLVLHVSCRRLVVANEYFTGEFENMTRTFNRDEATIVMPTMVGWQNIDCDYKMWNVDERERVEPLTIETDEIFEIDNVEWLPAAAYVKNPDLPHGLG